MNAGLQHFIQLLWGMTEKELRVRYKYTFFGFLWLVINPLLQMAVIGFVLNFFMNQQIEHYYYYLYTGLLVWNFFSLSLVKATPSIVNERYMIKKSMFPRSIIPLSIILSNFIHLVLGFTLFTIVTVILGITHIWGIFSVVGGLIELIIFTCGLCLLTAAFNVRYRDVKFFVEAFLILWFYATPIFYSLSQIPEKYIWIWRLNPMTSIVQLFQHGFVSSHAPEPVMLGINTVIIIVILAAGIIVFTKESINFDDWV